MLRSSSLAVAVLLLALSTPSNADHLGRLGRLAAQPPSGGGAPMVQPPAPSPPATADSEAAVQSLDKSYADDGYPLAGKCGPSCGPCCDAIWDDYCWPGCGWTRWHSGFHQARYRPVTRCAACDTCCDVKGGAACCSVPTCDVGCGAKQVGCGLPGRCAWRSARPRRAAFWGYGCGVCVDAIGCEPACKGCGDAGWSAVQSNDRVAPPTPTPAPAEARPSGDRSANRWPLRQRLPGQPLR